MYIRLSDEKVVSVLQKVTRSLTRKKVSLLSVVMVLRKLIQSTFEEQRDPWGRPWMPLAIPTVNVRVHTGNMSTEKLLDSYRLYGSIEAQATDEYGEVDFDGTDEYAWVQQQGNELNRMFGKGSAPIPARPFLPLAGTSQRLNLPSDWSAKLIAPLETQLRKDIQ